MGHNRAGDNHKKRIKRRKKEDRRLDIWAKGVLKNWNIKRNYVWAFIGNCSDGNQLLCSADEPMEDLKIKIDLPKPMTLTEAMDYFDQNNQIEQTILKNLYCLKTGIYLPKKN